MYSQASPVELGQLLPNASWAPGATLMLKESGCQSSWFGVFWLFLFCFTVIFANTTPRAIVTGFII